MCRPVVVTAGALMVSMIGPRVTLGLTATTVGGVVLVAVVRTGLNVAMVTALTAAATIALIALPVWLAKRANRPVSLGHQYAPVRAPVRTVLRLEARPIQALPAAATTPEPLTTATSARYSA